LPLPERSGWFGGLAAKMSEARRASFFRGPETSAERRGPAIARRAMAGGGIGRIFFADFLFVRAKESQAGDGAQRPIL